MSRRRKILTLVGTVLGLAILLPVIRHYQLRAAVEAYIAQLKAEGEPMDLATIIPPPVPPENNGASAFLAAAGLINQHDSLNYSNSIFGMKMVAPGKAMIRWQQPDVRDDSTNSWPKVMAAVVQNKKSFGLLQQIVDKPDFDFQIQYDPGVADMPFTNFYLVEVKRAAECLETAALCDLHQGDSAAAVNHLRAMLALVKAMHDERFAISELVRIALAQIALSVNWELLQSPNLADAQLAELQHDWMNLDFVRSEEKALEMERVSGEISLTKWRMSNFELLRYFGLEEAAQRSFGMAGGETNLWNRFKRMVRIYLWRNWWSYSDELRSLKGYDALIKAVRMAETNGCFMNALAYQTGRLDELGIPKIPDEFFAFFSDETDLHTLLSQSIVGLSTVTKKVMQAEVAEKLAATAIALKRYQIKHGNYPTNLNSLVPEFIPEAARDPADGQPLRYRLNADGTFLLYSVGENGKDDGGDPSLEKGTESSSFYWLNLHALDWVWPQPATPAEVQYFYEHPPK